MWISERIAMGLRIAIFSVAWTNIPSNAAEPADVPITNFTGCYNVITSSWWPALPKGEVGNYILPGTIHLSSRSLHEAPGTRHTNVFQQGFAMTPASGATVNNPVFTLGSWEPESSGRIRLHWGQMEGVSAYLEAADSHLLFGIATLFSDAKTGMREPECAILFRKVECGVQDSSAATQ